MVEKVKIGDVIEGLYDGPHATPYPSDTGPIFLGIKNITDDGRLDFSEIRHISEEEYPKWTKRVTPQANDIVFTYEATLHRYAIIPEGFYGCLGRRLALIRPDHDKIDVEYLFYYFFSEEWRREVKKYILHGSSVDRIPLTDFPDFEIYLPYLETQREIASTLSKYDQLIKNNSRRIEILEEVARRIYREWFVHFRYPGHQEDELVDSDTELGEIPEGWEVKNFDKIAEVLSGGTPKTKVNEYWDGDLPFFSPKDATENFFVHDTSKTVSQKGVENCASKLYPPKTVFITARGTVGKLNMPLVPMAMNQSCYALKAKDGLGQYFIFFSIENLVKSLQKKRMGLFLTQL